MKKKLGVFVALVLTLALALSFVGCGGQKAQDGGAKQESEKSAQSGGEESPSQSEASNLEKSLAIDISDVRGSDGQLLLKYGVTREVPPKPTDKEALELWSIEYAGRLTEKEPMIPSPKDGIIGKRIVMIQQSEHPYWTAVSNGSMMAAEAYQCKAEVWNPNGDLNQQNQFIDKAIAEKVDMVLLAPLDAKAGVQQFKKLYDAGIPAIAYNMIPTDEAMRYVLAITAPDDFGQFKMLAEHLAKAVDGKAGVGYITHIPGGSPYFARTTNVINYYKENYPDMKTLDIQSPGFDAPKVKQVVSDWITRFGDELTCIVLADDSAQALGASQAIEEAGRDDIKVIAAGNSKVGMDLVKAGKLFAITYQSAEADGAIPIKVAADYFNGVDLGTNAAFYLPQAVITKDNVDEYMPAQW
ncbi:MAG: sugar ABC transporter substrate-binding protein [Acetivibrionales bacterium]